MNRFLSPTNLNQNEQPPKVYMVIRMQTLIILADKTSKFLVFWLGAPLTEIEERIAAYVFGIGISHEDYLSIVKWLSMIIDGFQKATKAPNPCVLPKAVSVPIISDWVCFGLKLQPVSQKSCFEKNMSLHPLRIPRFSNLKDTYPLALNKISQDALNGISVQIFDLGDILIM